MPSTKDVTSTQPRRHALTMTDRQQVAARLLASSAKKSYDPNVEIDWAAPVPSHLFGLTPEWSTLYGTAMWDEMSLEQQVTLTKHEVASISGTGIWFEMILMQMLVRDMYGRDASAPHFQFALTEIADECRHSVMFARASEKFGCPAYRPNRPMIALGRIFAATASGAVAYGGTLFAEEILDVMQREFMKDERVQPVTRTVSKIHVLEEARHIRFAREEAVRRVEHLNKVQRARVRVLLAGAAYAVATNLVGPQVYAAAGLDVKRAVAAAKTNEHYQTKLRHGASKTMEFLTDLDLIGGPSRLVLRKAHLL
ncbi:MAG: AurF N-oxygenase family protein [Mycobacteriaceae bacterium]